MGELLLNAAFINYRVIAAVHPSIVHYLPPEKAAVEKEPA
jgi:hypothetical protein